MLSLMVFQLKFTRSPNLATVETLHTQWKHKQRDMEGGVLPLTLHSPSFNRTTGTTNTPRSLTPSASSHPLGLGLFLKLIFIRLVLPWEGRRRRTTMSLLLPQGTRQRARAARPSPSAPPPTRLLLFTETLCRLGCLVTGFLKRSSADSFIYSFNKLHFFFGRMEIWWLDFMPLMSFVAEKSGA